MGRGFLTGLLAGAVATVLLASFPTRAIHPSIPESVLSAACEKQVELVEFRYFVNIESDLYWINIGEINNYYFSKGLTRTGDSYINTRDIDRVEWVSEDGISPSSLYHLVSRGRPIIKAETLESVMHRGEASLAGHLVSELSEEERNPVLSVINAEDNNAQVRFRKNMLLPYTQEEVAAIINTFDAILQVQERYKELAGCTVEL